MPASTSSTVQPAGASALAAAPVIITDTQLRDSSAQLLDSNALISTVVALVAKHVYRFDQHTHASILSGSIPLDRTVNVRSRDRSHTFRVSLADCLLYLPQPPPCTGVTLTQHRSSALVAASLSEQLDYREKARVVGDIRARYSRLATREVLPVASSRRGR